MFGFSIVSVLTLFYVTVSVLASVLVVAACVASGNASRASDELFLRSEIKKRGFSTTPATTAGSLSNIQPLADHRFLAGAETKEEEVQKPAETPTEKQPIRTM